MIYYNCNITKSETCDLCIYFLIREEIRKKMRTGYRKEAPLKVHKREKFFGSDFELITIL
jgi:hypothetical protein